MKSLGRFSRARTGKLRGPSGEVKTPIQGNPALRAAPTVDLSGTGIIRDIAEHVKNKYRAVAIRRDRDGRRGRGVRPCGDNPGTSVLPG